MRGICLLVLISLSAGPARVQLRVLATADTEGHVTPCKSCPVHVGLGGLARRATLIAQARERDPDLLLLDAGNFLFGPDSLDSRGQVMIAAYNALGYDVVNLSYRDFRLGVSHTRELLRESRFQPVSANLIDSQTGRLLVEPYVVDRNAAGRRVAILGLTDPPAGWQQIERLREQLDGLKVIAASEALAEWLPKAAGESDRVIVLYYGSPAGLARLKAAAGDRIACILAGGMDVDAAASSTGVPVAAAEPHGKSVVELTWPGAAGPALRALAVSPDIPDDPRMQQILAPFAPAAARVPPKPATQPFMRRQG